MNKKLFTISLVLILVFSFGISAYVYPAVPDQIPSHWNINDEVDGYMSKTWGLLFMPLVLLLISGIFIAIPHIDPLRKNIAEFKAYYDGFVLLIAFFMLLVHLQVILWSMGFEIRPSRTIPFGMGALFYYSGILMKRAKRNWFVGIRTPWTLSSDIVWEKTHKLGAKLFQAIGALMLVATFFPPTFFVAVIIGAVFAALVPVVYSYFAYRNEKA